MEDTPYQRLEIKLQNCNCSMADLGEELLVNFSKVNFFHPSFLEDERFSVRFVKNVYRDGLNVVFNKIYKVNRRKLEKYKNYLNDFQVFPIEIDKLDFGAAHKKALGSLLHPDYRDRLL